MKIALSPGPGLLDLSLIAAVIIITAASADWDFGSMHGFSADRELELVVAASLFLYVVDCSCSVSLKKNFISGSGGSKRKDQG
ncbi:hypothetical protein RIF29_25510 [Crotalaria pallida]|uniref:Uncharacterized protein n=1 Tax=Crotalaria pallida TaxID=3830 RepID=A0AAN9ENW9_CROPI